MFMVKFRVFVLSGFALLLSSNVIGQEVDLKVGVLHFPPFYIVGENDQVSGIYTDIIKRVVTKAGYSFSMAGFPPKRFYKQLGDNTTNFFLGVKGSKFIEGKVEYGKLEFEGIQLRIYSSDDSEILTTKEQLKAREVIVIRGFGYGGLAQYLQNPENNIKTIEATDHYSAFKMLSAGRAKYLLDYRATSNLVIDKLKLTGINYGVLQQAYTYFIINKAYPEYAQVLQNIEDTYIDLVNNEGIEDIRVNR